MERNKHEFKYIVKLGTSYNKENRTLEGIKEEFTKEIENSIEYIDTGNSRHPVPIVNTPIHNEYCFHKIAEEIDRNLDKEYTVGIYSVDSDGKIRLIDYVSFPVRSALDNINRSIASKVHDRIDPIRQNQ